MRGSRESAGTRQKGVYLLLFRVGRGAWGPGSLRFPPGPYAYAGSAKGGGGLAARLRRHLNHDDGARIARGGPRRKPGAAHARIFRGPVRPASPAAALDGEWRLRRRPGAGGERP